MEISKKLHNKKKEQIISRFSELLEYVIDKSYAIEKLTKLHLSIVCSKDGIYVVQTNKSNNDLFIGSMSKCLDFMIEQYYKQKFAKKHFKPNRKP